MSNKNSFLDTQSPLIGTQMSYKDTKPYILIMGYTDLTEHRDFRSRWNHKGDWLPTDELRSDFEKRGKCARSCLFAATRRLILTTALEWKLCGSPDCCSKTPLNSPSGRTKLSRTEGWTVKFSSIFCLVESQIVTYCGCYMHARDVQNPMLIDNECL